MEYFCWAWAEYLLYCVTFDLSELKPLGIFNISCLNNAMQHIYWFLKTTWTFLDIFFNNHWCPSLPCLSKYSLCWKLYRRWYSWCHLVLGDLDLSQSPKFILMHYGTAPKFTSKCYWFIYLNNIQAVFMKLCMMTQNNVIKFRWPWHPGSTYRLTQFHIKDFFY